MSSNLLKSYSLSEVCSLITDGTHATHKEQKNGKPLATIKDMSNFGISFESCKIISESDFQELKKNNSVPQIDDLLFSKDGSMLKEVIVNKQKDFAITSHIALLRTKKDILKPIYLKYYLSNKVVKEDMIRNYSSGSVIPSLILKDINKYAIKIPPLYIQDRIANILSSLDDKIELNNKINQKLETLAQTLYKHWFVDFEFPNENGEPYKSSGGEIVDSELGLIPKGWSIQTLADLVIKQKNKILPDEKHKLIDMASMPSHSISLSQYEPGDKLKTNTYSMEKYSFLYGSIRPYLGKYGISPFNGITTGTIHNFISKITNNYSFVASLVFSNQFNDYCIQLSHGTKMPIVKWNDFIDYKFAFNDRVASLFNKTIKSNYLKIVENVLENQKLAEIRDTLLPKLMNGEIEVPV